MNLSEWCKTDTHVSHFSVDMIIKLITFLLIVIIIIIISYFLFSYTLFVVKLLSTWRTWILTSWYDYESNQQGSIIQVNPLKAELNPISHLLALLGAHHILHVSRIRVNLLFLVDFTCFGRCFRPSSGALDCIYSFW